MTTSTRTPRRYRLVLSAAHDLGAPERLYYVNGVDETGHRAYLGCVAGRKGDWSAVVDGITLCNEDGRLRFLTRRAAVQAIKDRLGIVLAGEATV